jgi:UDP-N-acetyl-2-amino-2-deoxyglucuronate dehydrogenase
MKNFALTGVAGYIAPRHLKAIKETGNNLIAALDPHDSVGILDQYFPDAAFFTEFERFDRHIEMLKRKQKDFKLDYLSICSPNNLHDAHIRFALRIGADAICEKPLVLNPWNLDALQSLEKEFNRKIYTVLQLRLHPSLIELKKNLLTKNQEQRTKNRVILKYITSRGLWYNFSWKGDNQKSGGIATNIGIHLFDLLIWLFGKVEGYELETVQQNKMGGTLQLARADVKWFMSIDKNDLPEEALKNKHSTFRSIQIDGNEIEFTEGFTDLHTEVYKEIIAGRGFGIDDSRPSIELVQKIRELAKYK